MKGKVLDQLVAALSTRKRFQIFILILLGFNYVPLVFNHVVMAFYKGTPAFYCQPSGGLSSSHVDVKSFNGNYSQAAYNSTDQHDAENNTTPTDPSLGKCSVYVWRNATYADNGLHNKTHETESGAYVKEQCMPGQWVFDDKESTIVSEWDLVCDRRQLANLATTIYFTGVMTGGLLFGFLSDSVGRLPILLITLYASVAVGVATSFANSYVLFVVLRYVQGALMQGLQTSSYVMAMELFMPAQRPFVGAIMECFWGGTVMILAGLAYVLPHWRHLQLAISLPSILAVFYICVMPESLRWLILKKSMDRAEKLVHRMSTFNRIAFPKDVWDVVMREAKASPNSSQQFHFFHLFKTPKLRKRTLVLFYLWLTIATGYFGLTFNITALPGNKYLNFFISGAVEFVHYVLSMWVMVRFGRKKPLLVCFICAGVCCIVTASIPRSGPNSVGNEHYSTAFAIVGRFFMAGLFSIIFVYTTELYPTVIRNIGMGSCVFWARLGGVIAPQINQLGAGAVVFVPIMVFGIMMLGGGFLLLLLPETHGRKLPDVIDDVEKTYSDSNSLAEPEPYPGQELLIRNGDITNENGDVIDENGDVIRKDVITENGDGINKNDDGVAENGGHC